MAYIVDPDVEEIEELNETILALANQCGDLQQKLKQIKNIVDEALHSSYYSISALYHERTEALEKIQSIFNQERGSHE